MTANHRPLDPADILLIQRVEQNPTLYDPRSKDFHSAHQKELMWEKVAASLDISADDAKRRWTCLRDRYSRELKQLRLFPNKGVYGKNDFFRQMDFLRAFVKKRRKRTRKDFHEGLSAVTPKKLIKLINTDKTVVLEELDQDDPLHGYAGSEHNYESKMEVHTTQPDDYTEYVEGDNTAQSYEEFVDHPPPPTPSSISAHNVKQVHASISPNFIAQTTQSSPGYPYYSSMRQTIEHQLRQPPQSPAQHQYQQQHQQHNIHLNDPTNTEDDFFCKSIAAYLRQLSRRNKIKAKVEMYQILEKYIEIEENSQYSTGSKHNS